MKLSPFYTALGHFARRLDEAGEKHEYDSLRQMQGSMNLASCPDPRAYERANCMLMLQGWHAGD